MDLSALAAQYRAETDSKKKFELLRSLVAKSASERDPGLGAWIQEIISFKPVEVPLASLTTCPKCGKMMVKSKILKVPPRAEFWFLSCEACGVQRVTAYLNPYSKGMVHLVDVSMYEDMDELKRFIDAKYEVELQPLLMKIAGQTKDPAIKAFCEYKVASLLKTKDPKESERLFESARGYYSSLKVVANPELDDILANLMVMAINRKDFGRALVLSDQLSARAQSSNDHRLLISSRINKAVALELMEKFEESAETYVDAMNLAEEHGHPDLFDQASTFLERLLEHVKARDEKEAE